MEYDPDLLYEDLFEDLKDGRAVIKTSVHEMEDRLNELSNEAEELRCQVRSLQEQNEKLSKQNDVLIRNISCLFKTAQMEISRKDKQLRNLQQESLIASTPDPSSQSSRGATARKWEPDTAVGNERKQHGESFATISKAEGMSHQGKPSSTSNGSWKDARRACAQHQESVKLVSNGKSDNYGDELRKRRRDDEEPRHEHHHHHHHAGGNERHLAGARRGEGHHHHRHSFNAHVESEGNRAKRVCS